MNNWNIKIATSSRLINTGSYIVFFWSYMTIHTVVVCSFGHCVVCPLIYGFGSSKSSCQKINDLVVYTDTGRTEQNKSKRSTTSTYNWPFAIPLCVWVHIYHTFQKLYSYQYIHGDTTNTAARQRQSFKFGVKQNRHGQSCNICMSTGLGQTKLQAYTISHCDTRNNILSASTLIMFNTGTKICSSKQDRRLQIFLRKGLHYIYLEINGNCNSKWSV